MKREKKVTFILLGIYLILLTWIILFKTQFSISQIGHIRSLNLIPFGASVIVNGKLDFDEIVNNAIVFIPVGVYMGMLFPEWSFVRKLCPAAGLSLAYEVLQFILALGATDITDLITNTFGGVIGLLVFAALSEILGERTNKILHILAGICTVLVIVFMAFIISYNV